MALRTNDVDKLRTLDFSEPSLIFFSDETIYPNNKKTLLSSPLVTTTTMSDYPLLSRSSAARQNEHDPNVDKFSTLFMPSAPRASPTLLPVPAQTSSNTFRSQVQKERPVTDDSRSLMSVSADEDPLSLSLASENPSLDVPTTFESDKGDDELFTSPVISQSMSVAQPSHQPTHPDNTSLTFFDKFVQDAKKNSEKRRKGFLDELLKCEDNPLYLLHKEKESAQKKNEEHQDDRPTTFDSDNQPTPDPELQTSPPSTPPPVDTVLNDLDQEYFSSGHLVNISSHDDADQTPSKRRRSGSSNTQSPSLPSPATLAPPIIDSDTSDLHIPFNKPSTRSDTSSSWSSPPTFSGKWMSNLLKTSSGSGHHQQQHGHGATPSLESMFGVNADPSSSSSHPPLGTSAPTAASTVSAIYRRNSSASPIRYHPTPHVSHTLPSPSTSSSLSGIIKHKASPFGTHTYIPPSGAPGFKGDAYDWDKGFSKELEREIVRGRSSDRGNGNGKSVGVDSRGEMLETEMQAHKRTDVGINKVGIGAFMEKKSGNLDLKGRKMSTDPVLSQNLAILVRYTFVSMISSNLFLNPGSLSMSRYARISQPCLVFLGLGH